MTIEAAPGAALPRGICDTCLHNSQARLQPVPDGGMLLGIYCPHNRTAAVSRKRPDGHTDPWRMESPVGEAQLFGCMSMLANVIAGQVDGQADLEKQRLRGLN